MRIWTKIALAFLVLLVIQPGIEMLGSSRIVFSSNGDLQVMDLGTRDVLALTTHRADEWAPSWSPDGQYVVYVSNQYRNEDLFMIEVANEVAIPIRLTDHSANDRDPSWSPGNTGILFSSDRDGDFELYILLPVDEGFSSEVQQITANGSDDSQAEWAPNDQRIVFVSDRTGNNDLFILDLSDGTVTQLTSHASSDDDPTWSPDGTRIAFSSIRDGNRELYVINADGSGLMRITEDPAIDRCPTWSPSGRQIAYCSFDPASNYGALHDLLILSLDTGITERLTDSPADEWFPAWINDE